MALTLVRQARILRQIRGQATPAILADGTPYYLLESSEIHFFTAGIVRSRVYASSGALEQLKTDAFRAAILHEREHQRSHDVAWRIALATLETAVRPIAPARRSAQALALECEFAADRAALAAGATRGGLFDAVVAASGTPVPQPSAGLSGSATVERLEALASEGPAYTANPAPLVGLLLGLATLPIGAHGLFWLGAVCL
jgi:beta-lactamase regulating signal transducer with metallopeptidase domain